MTYGRPLALVAIAACASSQPTTTTTSPTHQGPSEAQLRSERERKDREERAAIVSSHRKLESAQQDALGGTCEDPTKWATQHCTPSCYPVEPKDPRAGTKVAGALQVQHLVCQRGEGPWLVSDELDPKLTTKPARGRRPRPHKKGSWQADLAAAVAAHDLVIVAGERRTVHQPLTHESLQCVTVTEYTSAPRGKLDACGAVGRKTTCEVAGNAAARGINLVRYRLAEATQLHEAGKDPECQAAALDAVATARGLPRWRQYAKLNVGAWTEGLAYETRFDGTLDEDALFALAATLGTEAEQLYATCGGASARTTPEQEHAFHSCP